MIDSVRINPRHLFVEVRYTGFKEWEQLTSWQSAPLAVQSLIGELPAMISRPWVLPEGFTPQDGEVVATSSQGAARAAVSTSSSSLESENPSTDQGNLQAGQSTQEEVPSIISDPPAPAVTPARSSGMEATIEEEER